MLHIHLLFNFFRLSTLLKKLQILHYFLVLILVVVDKQSRLLFQLLH